MAVTFEKKDPRYSPLRSFLGFGFGCVHFIDEGETTRIIWSIQEARELFKDGLEVGVLTADECSELEQAMKQARLPESFEEIAQKLLTVIPHDNNTMGLRVTLCQKVHEPYSIKEWLPHAYLQEAGGMRGISEEGPIFTLEDGAYLLDSLLIKDMLSIDMAVVLFRQMSDCGLFMDDGAVLVAMNTLSEKNRKMLMEGFLSAEEETEHDQALALIKMIIKEAFPAQINLKGLTPYDLN